MTCILIFYQIREIIKEIHTREVIRENVDKDAINAVSMNAKCTIDSLFYMST